MKTNKLTDLAMLMLFAGSFIGINNCGSRTSSTDDATFEVQENGTSDLAIAPGPLSAYGRNGVYAGYPTLYIETTCGNGHDDDGDGLTDCEDTDCHIHPECAEFGPPLEEIINSRAITVYPNGLVVPEDLAILKARGNDDDDFNGWERDNFFAYNQRDCWVSPREQDPYFNIPLGEALVAGPDGPVGPLLDPASTVAFFGPRAGLINECEYGTDLMFHHMDDDNGAGAGAAGDTGDDDGGTEDDQNDDGK